MRRACSTSAELMFTNERTCMVSYIASPDVTTPPCEFMYMLICMRSIHQPMLLKFSDIRS